MALLGSMLLLSFVMAAETWTLGDDKELKAVSDDPEGRYLLAVSKLKKLADEGRVEELSGAVADLKKEFPEIAGKDLSKFAAAEQVYAKGDLTKAFRAYDGFCASYPASPLFDAALDREFSIGQAYLNGEKKRIMKYFKISGYAEGIKIMDKVIDRAGDSPIAVKAYKVVADSFEKRGKFEEAYERWSQVSSRWPTGVVGKETLLNMGRCKHAAYRSPEYDSSALISARSYYENYTKRYPEDAKKYEIDKRIEQINEQLAYKDYKIAAYYKRTGSNDAAGMYCEDVEENWPDSTGAKKAKDISDEIAKEKEEKADEKEDKTKEKKWLRLL